MMIKVLYVATDLEYGDVDAYRELYLNALSVSDMPASAISSLWVADAISSVLGVGYTFYIDGRVCSFTHDIINNIIS